MMKNSIYATAAGMVASAERLDTIANNLANVSTNGYKSDIPFEQTLRSALRGTHPQPLAKTAAVDMTQGTIKVTGRDLDMAIEGPGFFAVRNTGSPDNPEYYTRNGTLNLNARHQLVTPEGLNILDRFNKPITLFGQKIHINTGGQVFVDDSYFTTLKIVEVTDPNQLQKIGNTLFKLKPGAPAPATMETPQLQVGALEKSNVNLLAGISELTRTQRAFEMQRNAADLIFRIIRKTITEIPKPM